jgi:hypothetical protein
MYNNDLLLIVGILLLLYLFFNKRKENFSLDNASDSSLSNNGSEKFGYLKGRKDSYDFFETLLKNANITIQNNDYCLGANDISEYFEKNMKHLTLEEKRKIETSFKNMKDTPIKKCIGK